MADTQAALLDLKLRELAASFTPEQYAEAPDHVRDVLTSLLVSVRDTLARLPSLTSSPP